MAAGNWLTSAGLGDAAIAISARTIQAAVSDSIKNQEVIGDPVFQAMLAADAGLGQLMGALGIGSSFAAIGQGKMAATAEGTEASATNFSTANVVVIPARKAFTRVIGDFAVSIQAGLLAGELSPNQYSLLIYEGYRIWANSYVDMVVAHASSATHEIGVTGTSLTWAAMQEGIYDFKNRGASSEVCVALTAKGAKDLAADALSLGGAVAMSQQVQGFIANARSGAFICTQFGANFYLNSELDTDSGDDLGVLLSPGAIQTKHQRVPLPAEAEQVADTGLFTIEARRAGGGVTNFETVTHNSSAIAEQDRWAAVRYLT